MLRRLRTVEGLETAADRTVTTDDGVRLAAYTLHPAGEGGIDGARLHTAQLHTGRLHVVLCHGFTNHARRPQLVRIARRLVARGVSVTAFDFRGHGRSGGASSVGGDGELADLDAMVAQVRRDDPEALIAVMGFSMGASSAIRQAALGAHRPDLLVAVSAVSRWYVRDSAAMRRVHWLLESPAGPVTSRLALRTRLGEPWTTQPESPIDAIARLDGMPTLLVHGECDRYVGPDHARALRAAAGDRPDLWVVPGFGHAESAMTPGLLDRIVRWLERSAEQASDRPATRVAHR